MNPLNMIKGMMRNMNPKNIVMNMLKNNTNPIFANLIEMANKGDTKGLEQFARNYMKDNGKDFDKEFNEFKSMFNGK
ncbi:MAG: hypothetical protein SPI94_04070 [Candidatus Onthovivens sp.]|nr:hypothetical protein [Candidatus Onthovivens sp.]